MTRNFYKNLIEPRKSDIKIDISNYSKNELINYLSSMIKIRECERIIALGKKNKLIVGPVHLGAGQEAIAVGISKHLTISDKVFSGHRSHSHLLALGSSPRKLFAEILGKATGLSKGIGGSMHLIDLSNGFLGSVPIVAGTVPLSLGAAYTIKSKRKSAVAVSYFGDGAIEEGVVHESLNLAKILDLPILFVVENNLFSSHMHISLRQPDSFVSRFAESNKIPFEIIDGNNVLHVEQCAKQFINSAKNDPKPYFIEAITYRHYGHVDWRDDVDVGKDRSIDDLNMWKKIDPIQRLFESMNQANLLEKSEYDHLHLKIVSELEREWVLAINDPYPEKEQLLNNVYSKDSNLEML